MPVGQERRRAIVFGGTGQLGTELTRVFAERGWEVKPFERRQVDVTDAAAVEAVIGQMDPGVVLNAAAYNQVDIAEREPLAAYSGNGLAVRNMAVACRQNDSLLVHFSTDYVFDGEAGRPYTEEDWPHPLSAYGVSKLAGELYAQAYLERYLIIRTCGVFGPAGLRTARGNFVELMLRLAAEGKPIRVVEDHVASPTYAPALAERTADLVERGLTGLFHIGGGQAISWFEYARLIFQAAGVEAQLTPTNEREYRTLARRPRFSALSNAKMEAAGIAPMPPLKEALRLYMAARRQMQSPA